MTSLRGGRRLLVVRFCPRQNRNLLLRLKLDRLLQSREAPKIQYLAQYRLLDPEFSAQILLSGIPKQLLELP